MSRYLLIGETVYNIETLAKMTGTSRRTIRYYVQIGLLPPPEGDGRGSYYTSGHLRIVESIQKYSAQGVPLMKMKEVLEGKLPPDTPGPAQPAEVITVEQIRVHPNVVLSTTPGFFSARQIDDIRTFITQLINGEHNEQR